MKRIQDQPHGSVSPASQEKSSKRTRENTANSKRLEQVPAPINPNLMKVKIECDYVPVVVIKTEPDQDQDLNPVETEQDNNNSDDNEIGQQQQQQGKDQVVVKVETDVDVKSAVKIAENQKDKEAIANLEDRIKKYAYKVISLSREKTEIQTTLKKEIDKLNLVIGKQKSKILDLNSFISEQLDQNNRQSYQMAVQQKQIEELQRKLKTQVRIGDLGTEELSRIFDYLDINSLKESRLVCRRWRTEAGKILLENFYLVVDKKERCEKSLQDWITSKAIAQKLRSGHGEKTLQLLKKFPSLSSVRELRFLDSSGSGSGTESLNKILQLLPNIEVLETDTLGLNSTEIWLGNSREFYNGIPKKLELLIKKLQTLKKLKLDFGVEKETARWFFKHEEKFWRITNIEIYASGMDFIRDFLSQSSHNWSITRFTLDLKSANYKVELIRSFLLEISPGLKYLKFTVKSGDKSFSESVLEPWSDDWMIPIALLRLETLEIGQIEIDNCDANEFVVKSILVALRLPQLKKLSVDYIPMELEETIHKWNRHESANGLKLTSDTLKELELVKIVNPRKIPGNLWPGLKSLILCSWTNPESFDFSFLRKLRKLEHLELNIKSDWSDLNDTNDEMNYSQSSSKFHLRDLKNLRRFSLKVPLNLQRYNRVANFLVEKDLKFMKSLQSIQFHNVVIDAEPLKSALGPNVAIICTK